MLILFLRLLFCSSIHFSVLTRIRLCKHLSQNQHLVCWIFKFSNRKLTTLSVLTSFLSTSIFDKTSYLLSCFVYYNSLLGLCELSFLDSLLNKNTEKKGHNTTSKRDMYTIAQKQIKEILFSSCKSKKHVLQQYITF
jgi:hypothetical protein